MLLIVLAAVAGLLLALVLGRSGNPGGPTAAEVAQLAPQSDEVARVTLREAALTAIREGEYDRAVALSTQALALAPAEDDLRELLTIAVELKERRLQGVVQSPAVGEPSVPRPGDPAPEPGDADPVPADVALGLSSGGPTLGVAVITSTPKGASFEIPGVLRGQTPFRADLPVGSHEVVFYVGGRRIHSARIEIRVGGVEILDVSLPGVPSGDAP